MDETISDMVADNKVRPFDRLVQDLSDRINVLEKEVNNNQLFPVRIMGLL